MSIRNLENLSLLVKITPDQIFYVPLITFQIICFLGSQLTFQIEPEMNLSVAKHFLVAQVI